MKAVSIIILLYIASVILSIIGKAFIKKEREKEEFISKYSDIRDTMFDLFTDYTLNHKDKLRYSKVDDANQLFEIIINLFNKELDERKHYSRYRNNVYRQYKKEKNFEAFVNKKFIGIANYLRCFGVDKMTIKDNKVSVA